MKPLPALLFFILLFSCHPPATSYYLGCTKEDFMYRDINYLLVERRGDSLVLHHVGFDYNYGYFIQPGDTIIPFREGSASGYDKVLRIRKRSIIMRMDDRHVRLRRQRTVAKAYWLINIQTQQRVEEEMERYIREHSQMAEKNMSYISQPYNPDDSCSTLTPPAFERYYRQKMQHVADSIVQRLDSGKR